MGADSSEVACICLSFEFLNRVSGGLSATTQQAAVGSDGAQCGHVVSEAVQHVHTKP